MKTPQHCAHVADFYMAQANIYYTVLVGEVGIHCSQVLAVRFAKRGFEFVRKAVRELERAGVSQEKEVQL